MRTIKLTHANLPDRNGKPRAVRMLWQNVAGWHWNEPTACVIVYTTPQGVFPVKETEEEIEMLIEAAAGGERRTNG